MSFTHNSEILTVAVASVAWMVATLLVNTAKLAHRTLSCQLLLAMNKRWTCWCLTKFCSCTANRKTSWKASSYKVESFLQKFSGFVHTYVSKKQQSFAYSSSRVLFLAELQCRNRNSFHKRTSFLETCTELRHSWRGLKFKFCLNAQTLGKTYLCGKGGVKNANDIVEDGWRDQALSFLLLSYSR